MNKENAAEHCLVFSAIRYPQSGKDPLKMVCEHIIKLSCISKISNSASYPGIRMTLGSVTHLHLLTQVLFLAADATAFLLLQKVPIPRDSTTVQKLTTKGRMTG